MRCHRKRKPHHPAPGRDFETAQARDTELVTVVDSVARELLPPSLARHASHFFFEHALRFTADKFQTRAVILGDVEDVIA